MKLKGQRGQAMIIIVFAIIGLIGMTGLAVDGGMAYSDRRHAQNAADTAAMAGAMAKINASDLGVDEIDALTVAALDMAAQNGYDSNLVSNTVEVYTCDMDESSCGDPYADDADYVQVIITSHINTFFAGVIGIPQMHNRVQAIAVAEEKISGSLYNGDNLLSLAQECDGNPDNFTVEGNPLVTIDGGGLYINTDDPSCGFTCNSTGATITGDITTAGGDLDLSAQCEANITGDTATDGEQWDFPVTLADLDLDVPPECTSPTGTYANYPSGYNGGDITGFESVPVTVLTPGRYSNFPPNKIQPLGSLYDTILMKPGTYCVNTVVKLSSRQLVLVGRDVTFFLRAGYAFDMQGGTMILDAPNEGPYAGYLMILEPDYGSPLFSKDPLNCKINGGTTNSFIGAIFAPYCNITLNGGSEPTGFGSQIIGYTIKISGTASINFSYDAGQNPEINHPAEIGIVK